MSQGIATRSFHPGGDGEIIVEMGPRACSVLPQLFCADEQIIQGGSRGGIHSMAGLLCMKLVVMPFIARGGTPKDSRLEGRNVFMGDSVQCFLP